MKLEVCIFVYCFVVCSTCLEEDGFDLKNLEELDLQELLNLSSSGDDGHRKANARYKSKYGHLPVEIVHGRTMEVNSDMEDIIKSCHHSNITADEDGIDIGINIAGQFLKSFGQSIESLSIECVHMLGNKKKEIGKFINDYCSETLVEFKAIRYEDGAFDDMEKPFKKVERVIFQGHWQSVSENSLRFDQLFPNLNNLIVTTDVDCHIFDCTFPHLKYLNAKMDEPSNLFKFIQKHKQIRKLNLRKSSMQLLKIVNENLPKLEYFEFTVPIDILHYHDPAITFEQYEKVRIREYHYDNIVGKIAFNQLKHLELNVIEKVCEVWADFIGTNNELETLIIEHGHFINSALLRLSTILSSLIEADIACDSEVEVETIAQFVSNNPKMTKTQLKFTKSVLPLARQSMTSGLTEKLGKEWIVTAVDKAITSINITKSTSFVPVESTTILGTTNGTSHPLSSVITILFLAIIVNSLTL